MFVLVSYLFLEANSSITVSNSPPAPSCLLFSTPLIIILYGQMGSYSFHP